MNIFISSVGRRAYLVKYFKEALGSEGKVFVGNSDAFTSAFQYADGCVITPYIYDDNYIPFLLDYCKDKKVDILISVFDIDLPILSKNRDSFENIGVRLVVSDSEFVEICNDKWKTYNYLKDNGFNVPKTYLTLQKAMLALETGEIKYPIIVKPRFGCGSLAMSVAEDEMSLLYFYTRNTRTIRKTYLKYESNMVEEKIIYQECLNGQEYGADIINDLDGNFQNAVIKRKIRMRAGETDIAEIVNDEIIYAEMERLGKITGHIANLDCDVFMVDGKPYVLEMNARFGGGYPFSHIAGCNLPKAIIDWHNGLDVDVNTLKAESDKRMYKEIVMVSEK